MYEDIFTLNLIPEEKKSDIYNIVICSDNRIVDAIYPLMYSMHANLKRKVCLWILQSEYTDIQKNGLREYAIKIGININIIDIDKSKFIKFNSTRLPHETYYYLISHTILPESIDRCLFIDIDTIILKDIENLYDIDFDGKYLVAGNEYEEVKYNDYLNILSGKNDIKRGFLKNTEACFNSGVLLINLERFRKENVSIETYIDIIKDTDMGGFFHDQLIINRFVKGDIKIFPRLFWNCCCVYSSHYESNFGRNDKKIHEVYKFNKYNKNIAESIIHFCGRGAVKPWKGLIKFTDNNHPEVRDNGIKSQRKYIEYWWNYASHTPVYSRLIANSFITTGDKVENLERELTYWKSYTKIFRTIFENDDDIYTLISFFKANKYKNIAFYASTQVVMALIPFLERYGVTTSYVVENFVNRPEVVKQSFPRNEKNLPHVDAMIVADIMQTTSHVNRIREYVDFPVYSIFDVVEGKTDAKLVSKGVCHKVVRYLLKRFA